MKGNLVRTTVLFAAFAAIAAGQQSVGFFVGQVTDASQAVIPGAKVRVWPVGGDPAGAVTKTTDHTGQFSFGALRAGAYNVEASADGFSTVVLQIQIEPDKTANQTITLPIGAVTETINVTALAPGLMTTHASVVKRSRSKRGRSHAEYNTEEYSSIVENGFHAAAADPLSTFSSDVDTASYSNVRRFLRDGSLPPADAVRIEEFINYFTYDNEPPDGEHPIRITTESASCPWKPKNRLVRIGLRTAPIEMDELPPSNLTFLIDVSGSMDSEDKLPLLKKSLALLVGELRPGDSVAIVVYAGAASRVLNPTSGARKDKILESLERLHAGGSTAGAAGIQLAYETARERFDAKGNNRVILATDGDFNVGVSSESELIRLIEEERKEGVYLTVLGFGQGNIKDNKMEKLADHGNGSYAYIDDLLEARRVLVEQAGATLLTVAKDLKIQVEFNPAHVKKYRLVGYENRLLNDEDFADDKKDAGDMGAGHSVTALYEITPQGRGRADDIELKYQDPRLSDEGRNSGELMTVKVRYKPPQKGRSRLISQAVENSGVSIDEASDDLRFAAAVAELGMLLRDSEHKGRASWSHAARLAKSAVGDDPDGRRSELVFLIKTAEKLAAQGQLSELR